MRHYRARALHESGKRRGSKKKLIASCESVFKIHKVGKNGGSRFKSLMSFWKQSGKKPEELDDINMEQEDSHLYMTYIDIKNGCERLDLANIKNWCDLTGEKFTKSEIKTLLEIEQKREEVNNG